MFLSTIINTTVLVVPAITLLFTFISYGKFKSEAVCMNMAKIVAFCSYCSYQEATIRKYQNLGWYWC